MKRYSCYSCVRCWDFNYVHSFLWSYTLSNGKHHTVFDIGTSSNINGHYQSMHWSNRGI